MAGAELAKRAWVWRGWWVAACLVLLSPPASADAPKNSPPAAIMQLSMEPVHERVVEAMRRASARVAEAYEQSPVMVMGLGLAGALPWLATFIAIMRALRRRAERRAIRAAPVIEPERLADKAWIDIGDGADRVQLAFKGEILRIGRHSDNDIALEHNAVHSPPCTHPAHTRRRVHAHGPYGRDRECAVAQRPACRTCGPERRGSHCTRRSYPDFPSRRRGAGRQCAAGGPQADQPDCEGVGR